MIHRLPACGCRYGSEWSAAGELVVDPETYDAFISYSRADWRHAEDICSALRARGLKPFFDRHNLPPGLRSGPRAVLALDIAGVVEALAKAAQLVRESIWVSNAIRNCPLCV